MVGKDSMAVRPIDRQQVAEELEGRGNLVIGGCGHQRNRTGGNESLHIEGIRHHRYDGARRPLRRELPLTRRQPADA